MGKKKVKGKDYEYISTAKITLTPTSDYTAVVRTDNKARVSRNFKKITHKGMENRTEIEHFTETEEIIEGENISKTNGRNIKTADKGKRQVGKIKTEKKLPSQVEAKKGKPKTGKLSKGKGFRIPKEKFYGTLKETYDRCKKEEAEKGEKWTGTKIAERAKRLLKSRYGDKYDADFERHYLENKISKIKQGKL